MRRIALLTALLSSLAIAKPMTIFDGKADGWKMAGPGSFEIKDGIATAKDGMGLWWYEKELQNFSLRLQFKLDDPAHNSGIFVRFPNPGDNPRVAVDQGYEIQISGDQPGDKSTGAIYAIQSATKTPVKIGKWNDYHILCANDKIAVILNGVLINIFEAQAGRGDVKGYIGLQNHDPNSPVQFKNISIEEYLPAYNLIELLAQAGVPRYQLIKYWSLRTPAQPVMLPKRGGGERQGGKDWYRIADHGPAFFQTFADWYQGQLRPESAIKGIALSYSAIPTRQALFNTETLALLSATDQGTALHSTPWAGGHGPVNKFLNKDHFLFNNIEGPAWADSKGSFEDKRSIKGHGNLSYAQFDGYTRTGNTAIIDYTVHGTKIHDLVVDHQNGLARFLEITPHENSLKHRLASTSSHEKFSIKLTGGNAKITTSDGTHYLEIAPSKKTQYLSLLYSRDGGGEPYPISRLSKLSAEHYRAISKEEFKVEVKIDSSDQPWLVDDIPIPPLRSASPYESSVRTSDLDFFADGDRALLTTWDGDIWLVKGLKNMKEVTWKRYATGFFEPLGIKIVNDTPYIAGRDAIWKVTDINSDGEADRFEIFNNDVLITNNFHEFQFGLETDKSGNFYFAKAAPVLPGGRGFDKILPHNGSFMKVSRDGSKLEVIATGLRAPGGIGVGPNGEITTGENEGTWQPCCKINYWEPGKGQAFFGVENARHGNQTPFVEPICYLPMSVDNSGGQQLWVPKTAKFGIAAGELLHLSYGQSTIYHVLKEKIGDGAYQGGVTKIPLKLGSSAQRATFHPDGSLFVTGFRGWQTNAANEAAFQRVRYNPKAVKPIPTGMIVTPKGIHLSFEVELDEELANDPSSFTVQRWKYIRSAQYGSGHFSVDQPDAAAEKAAVEKESKKHRVQDKVKVLSAKLGADKKSIEIEIEGHKPTQQLRLDYDLESTKGKELIGTIHSTIHKLP